MKKLIFLIILFFSLESCTTQNKLYSWANYETASYNYLKKNNEESTKKLISNYEKIIQDQKGTRKIVPPGIYADYGFVLLQTNKTEEGKKMLKKEIALYPESKIFIDKILKMLE